MASQGSASSKADTGLERRVALSALLSFAPFLVAIVARVAQCHRKPPNPASSGLQLWALPLVSVGWVTFPLLAPSQAWE